MQSVIQSGSYAQFNRLPSVFSCFLLFLFPNLLHFPLLLLLPCLLQSLLHPSPPQLCQAPQGLSGISHRENSGRFFQSMDACISLELSVFQLCTATAAFTVAVALSLDKLQAQLGLSRRSRPEMVDRSTQTAAVPREIVVTEYGQRFHNQSCSSVNRPNNRGKRFLTPCQLCFP